MPKLDVKNTAGKSVGSIELDDAVFGADLIAVTGDLIDAFFVSEDKQATIIRQPGLPDRRLDKKDIRSTKFIRRSLMPEGLLDTLQDQQVADLLAYLMTLKG